MKSPGTRSFAIKIIIFTYSRSRDEKQKVITSKWWKSFDAGHLNILAFIVACLSKWLKQHTELLNRVKQTTTDEIMLKFLKSTPNIEFVAWFWFLPPAVKSLMFNVVTFSLCTCLTWSAVENDNNFYFMKKNKNQFHCFRFIFWEIIIGLISNPTQPPLSPQYSSGPRFLYFRACLHGDGGPQVGEVTRLGGVTRLSIQSLILIWSRLHDRWGDHMRDDYMERRVTPPKRVTSPARGPPPPCKQALSLHSTTRNLVV